ncbi:MAG: protein kinase, partial [Clostridia bacterium]|nr:protein kinase [Clostridia bacterium]
MQEPINLIGQSVNGFLFTKKLFADAQSACYLAQHDSGASYLIKHQEYPSPALLKGIAATGRNPEEYFISRVQAMGGEMKQIKAVAQTDSHLSEPADLMVTRRAGGFPFDLFLCEKHRGSLTQQIKQKGLTLGEGFKVAKDVLGGLRTMHAANLLHGNLSLDSVFCGDQNTYVLGGYSAIRPEKENLAFLTAGDAAIYMAPEVLAGEVYDKQSEVYAAGIMLYMLFNNNRLPYPDMQTAIRERMSNKIMPMPLRAPEAVGQVILRALSDRANRYPDAIAFLEALEQTQGIPAESAKMLLFSPASEGVSGETTDLRKELGEMPLVQPTVPPKPPVIPPVDYDEEPKKSRKGLVIALILVSVLL